jgi:hypothetical protein
VSRSYWCNPTAGGCGKTEGDQRALDSAARALMVEILSDTRNTDEIEHAAYEAVSEAVQLGGGGLSPIAEDEARSPSPATTWSLSQSMNASLASGPNAPHSLIPAPSPEHRGRGGADLDDVVGRVSVGQG